MSRQEQKPDFWVQNLKKVRVEKIQIFSDLKKIYSGLQIEKIENFYDPQNFSNPVISLCSYQRILPHSGIEREDSPHFKGVSRSKKNFVPKCRVFALGDSYMVGVLRYLILYRYHRYIE